MNSPATSPDSTLLDYLKLMRLPNVFTAFGDVLMGFVLVHPFHQPWTPLGLLLVATGCLYVSGMVLNDWFDLEIDRQERPERPLPSGRISLTTAACLGFGLLVAGVLAASLSPWTMPEARPGWLPGLIGLVLAGCILAYNGWLKKNGFGPFAMGSCRTLNVLLGMSLLTPDSYSQWQPFQLLAAGGIGVYILGVTVFARGEAGTSPRGPLGVGVAIMTTGILMLAAVYSQLSPPVTARLASPWHWYGLLGLLTLPIAIRAVRAIVDPAPGPVQATIKQCLVSLIVFDAALILLCGPPQVAVFTVCLMIPMLILGKWVYST